MLLDKPHPENQKRKTIYVKMSQMCYAWQKNILVWQSTDATTTCVATWHNRSPPCDTHTCTLHTKVHTYGMVLPSHWTSVHNNMQKTLQVLCGIRTGVAAKLRTGWNSRRGRKESETDHIPRCTLPAEHCGGLPYPSLWARDSYSHMGFRHAGRTMLFVAGWGISADSSRKSTPPHRGFSLSVFSLSLSLSLFNTAQRRDRNWVRVKILEVVWCYNCTRLDRHIL